MAEIYTEFADVYDELMDGTPYGEWCDTLAGLIEEYGISKPVCGDVARREEDVPRRQEETGAETGVETGASVEEEALASERNLVLDLGCGTGTLTELMYRKGYDMIGVDNSPAMLNIAMEKRDRNGSEILYLQQDMRELELYSTVGTVISVCDSLNYLLEEAELLDVFKKVNNYLYPGGLFIFDFNTEYKYHEVIGNTTIAENRENCSFIWENTYVLDSCINEYDLTVFVREEGEVFRRFEEMHMQRGYTLEQMTSLVEQAGLLVVKTLDADTKGPVTEKSERVYVLARECTKSAK